MTGAAPAVDLRSDTVTRPTRAMRGAMAEAEVGDDALDGDPTARRLEARVAELLGKERALFFPSGTMANQTALALLAAPSTEVVVDADAHVFHYEEAAAAALSGIQLRPVQSDEGRLRPEDVAGAIRPDEEHLPRTAAVALENTHMASGGRALGPSAIDAVAAVARSHEVGMHLDGARLWNASVALGASPERLAEAADTVMVSLSKGLGAPVGSILAGTEETMERAWRIRHRLGGQMRQIGGLAAAALYALDHHRHRLSRDHDRARDLAAGLDELSGVRVVRPETNVVMVDLPDGPDPPVLLEALRRREVGMIPFGPGRIRAVTHLDVDDGDVRKAVEAFGAALSELRG